MQDKVVLNNAREGEYIIYDYFVPSLQETLEQKGYMVMQNVKGDELNYGK